MGWNLDADKPIYLQLMEYIQQDILSGRYKSGDKFPSVRELAIEAGVNPNTMQKALAELEREGIVYTMRTSGRFVTEDQDMLKKLKKERAGSYIQELIDNLMKMGLDKKEILAFVEAMIEGD